MADAEKKSAQDRPPEPRRREPEVEPAPEAEHEAPSLSLEPESDDALEAGILSRLMPGWKALYMREVDRKVKSFGGSRVGFAEQILQRQESVGWDYSEEDERLAGPIGDALVRAAFHDWQVDEQWSVWEDQSFEWWPSDLRQRVWYDASYETEGLQVVRVNAAMDLLAGVALPPAEIDAALNDANAEAALTTLVWDPEARTICLRSALWAHAEVLDQMKWLLGFVGIMQICQAHRRIDDLAKRFRASRASSFHPTSGPRCVNDDMLRTAEEFVIPAGAQASGWHEKELEEVRDWFLGGGIEAWSEPPRLAVRLPFASGKDADAVLAVTLDERHPYWGAGASVRLAFPLRIRRGLECSFATLLADQEFATECPTHCLGSWRAVELPAVGWSIVHDAFYPRAVQRRRDLINVAASGGIRARWLADWHASQGITLAG